MVKNPPARQEMQETWIRSLGWDDPLEEKVAINSSILARKISQREEPHGIHSLCTATGNKGRKGVNDDFSLDTLSWR